MLYDKDIVLDFEMPDVLKNYVDQLDAIVTTYNDFSDMPLDTEFDYVMLIDQIDVVSKSYLGYGISHSQRSRILNRYGI